MPGRRVLVTSTTPRSTLTFTRASGSGVARHGSVCERERHRRRLIALHAQRALRGTLQPSANVTSSSSFFVYRDRAQTVHRGQAARISKDYRRAARAEPAASVLLELVRWPLSACPRVAC